MDSDFALSVPASAGIQHYVVPAGWYYLEYAETGYSNLITELNPRPTDRGQAIEVPAQSTVYIGDFHFDRGLNFTVEFLQGSLLDALKSPDVPKLPLKISAAGMPIISLKWE